MMKRITGRNRLWLCAMKTAVFSGLILLAPVFLQNAEAITWPTAPSSFGSDLSLSYYGSGMTFYNYSSPNNGQGLATDRQSPTLVPGQPVPAISASASLPAGTLSGSLNDGNGSDILSFTAQIWDTLTFSYNPTAGSGPALSPAGELSWTVNSALSQPSPFGTTYDNVNGYACLEIGSFLCGSGDNASYDLNYMYGVPANQFDIVQYSNGGSASTPLSLSVPLSRGGSVTIDAALFGTTAGGGMISLDPALALSLPPGWTYTSASGVFLDSSPPLAETPEPSSWVLFGSASLLLAIRGRKACRSRCGARS
jgi:hypothetical protein